MGKKVWRYAPLDEVDHWCEHGCKNLKDKNIYISNFSAGFSSCFYCEDCVKDQKMEILGWVESSDEYRKVCNQYNKR